MGAGGVNPSCTRQFNRQYMRGWLDHNETGGEEEAPTLAEWRLRMDCSTGGEEEAPTLAEWRLRMDCSTACAVWQVRELVFQSRTYSRA